MLLLNDITIHFVNLECKNKHYGIKLCQTIQVTLYICSVSLTVPLFTVVKVWGLIMNYIKMRHASP